MSDDEVANMLKDLRKMIIELDDFTDDPNHCGERVLEAVLLA